MLPGAEDGEADGIVPTLGCVAAEVGQLERVGMKLEFGADADQLQAGNGCNHSEEGRDGPT